MKAMPRDKNSASPSRPSVPRDVAREVLVEAGHRCAVCGVPCPLERAHIVPWSKKKTHERADLICLCANCHQRADLEKWGEKTLRKYKLSPWVLRQNNVPAEVGVATQVELVIDMEINDFDRHKEEILRYALAAFLKIAPQSVRIRSKEEGSVRITLDLPKAAAKELLAKSQAQSAELQKAIPSFTIIDVRQPRRSEAIGAISVRKKGVIAIGSKSNTALTLDEEPELLGRLRPRLKQILARYRIPQEVAEELIQETLIETIKRWKEIRDPESWLLVTLRNRCIVYWRRMRTKLYSSVDAALLELELLSQPESTLEKKAELLWNLKNLIDELPERCRTILRLRYGLDYDSDAVARKMRYHPLSVEKISRRCLMALAKLMASKGLGKGNEEK